MTKKTAKVKKQHSVAKKRNGRYMVVARGGKLINGEEKVKILVEKGVLKAQVKKQKAEGEEAAAQ